MRRLCTTTSSATTCAPPTSRDERVIGERAISPVRGIRTGARARHWRHALGMLAMLALVAPTSLRGQALDHSASAPPSGPFELVGRAGVGALTFTRAAFAPSTVGIDDRAELARGDTSDHHGSRAHHAAVGALIGGAVGLVLGVAGDRPGLGRGEMRGGHFHNLWLVTVPLGALVGALAGTL